MLYKIKQGEDQQVIIDVKDSSGNSVELSGSSSISVQLFIKESLQVTFSTGITNTTDVSITSYSGSTVTINLTRELTKNFPVGDILASILVKTDVVKEYDIELGSCIKGYSKNKTI